MLAGPDPLVILYMACDSTQDDLLHQLPRHRGQAARPVVPRVLLPALLEDGCHIRNMSGNPFSPSNNQGLSCEEGWRLNHFPGQPVPMLDNPFSEVKFPNIQSKPPLAQLEAISSCPITCYLGEETDPHLSTTSFQCVNGNFVPII
ncbi:hypothetical protein QYF61_023335 [Mycteria americana]|uniref:Uncharacterized protein n=1 Tax=Mycteria americana TaxID=33587 RepID=A0AAN7NI66_MYCAM|nr:hypothetical protein QYF61_023335 [Mycteria americana]